MKFRSENFEISSKDLQHNDKDIDQTMLKICSIEKAVPKLFPSLSCCFSQGGKRKKT